MHSLEWERDAHTSLRFWDTNGSWNLSQTTRPSDSKKKKKKKKENLPNSGLCYSSWSQSKIEKKQTKREMSSWTLRRNRKKKTKKKIWNMKVTVMPIVSGALGTITKKIGKETEGIGNKNRSGDNPNYGIMKISQNTGKSPGDVRRLVVP